MPRTDPEDSVATPKLLAAFRDSLLDLAAQVSAAIELMEKESVDSVEPVGNKTLKRSIHLIEGCIDGVMRATKKRAVTRSTARQPAPPQMPPPQLESKQRPRNNPKNPEAIR